MKGIVLTVRLVLAWSTMTRRLQTVGLALVAAGLAGLRVTGPPGALFVIMVIIGVVAAAVSPALMGGVVFRSISASRTLQLVRNGRLQLALGAMASQMLLAGLIAGVIATMAVIGIGTRPLHIAVAGGVLMQMFVRTFALLTLQFIGFFLVAALRVGMLWLSTWIIWSQLIQVGYHSWHLGDLLASAAGLTAVLGLTVLAWIAFVVGCITVRRIQIPHWNNFGLRPPAQTVKAARPARASSQRTFTRLQALRTLLWTRSAHDGNLWILIALPAGLLLFAVFNALQGHWNPGHLLSVVLCMLAGPLAGSCAGVMAQRARPLWLLCGMGRAELFAELEARSWRIVLIAAVLWGGIGALWLIISPVFPSSPLHRQPVLLVTPLASGALFVYAQLQHVRGARLADSAILGAAIALYLAEAFSVMLGADSAVVSGLIAIQIILVLPLRALARRRWQRLDWLIHKRAPLQWGGG